MQLSRELFWDTSCETADWEKSYQYVVCRVLEYGKLEDWKVMGHHYGDQKIIDSAINHDR
jgi:hypothetical protein